MPNINIVDARRALVGYVLEQVGLDNFETPFDLSPYWALLPKGEASSLTHVLTAIDKTDDPGSARDQPAWPLDNLDNFVTRSANAVPNQAMLKKALSELKNQITPEDHFEQWAGVFRRMVSGVQAKQREVGVSLYHEFKALSAIVHAASQNPDASLDSFNLVRGDFPGIQRTIYTIGSDGAAKGVRGRSLFLQLLADCVVRRFLTDLHLPITNAIYVAGGNFLLLTGINADETVEALTLEISRNLLGVFRGDLSLITATHRIEAAALVNGTNNGFVADLGKAALNEGRSKAQPMRLIAMESESDFDAVFKEHGGDGRNAFFCVACQREAIEPAEIAEVNATLEKEKSWTCADCRVFEELAVDVTKLSKPVLVFDGNSTKTSGYPERLRAITGWSCNIQESGPRSSTTRIVWRLNDANFEPRRESGFRHLAVHTPIMTVSDVAWKKKHHPVPLTSDEAQPKVNNIRDFELLASVNAPGFPRLGILRMDVDSLGQLFQPPGSRSKARHLQPLTFTRLMAASDALSLFFEGYLPHLCKKFELEMGRPNSVYLLYGGGDDLFIVGEWEIMPKLATKIRNAFSDYCAGQLSISAGIVIVPEHFPFYRAADMAKAALDNGAKKYVNRVGEDAPEKDAIQFLGVTLPWGPDEDWQTVIHQRDLMIDLARKITHGKNDKSSDIITRTVQRIYDRWDADRRNPRYANAVYYGPYMWLEAYQMKRLMNQYLEKTDEGTLSKKTGEEENKILLEQMNELQNDLLNGEGIRLAGVSSRWAELILRAETNPETGD